MAGYFIANYTITNPDGYQEYLAAAGPTLTAHGAERIVVDRGSDLLEGSAWPKASRSSRKATSPVSGPGSPSPAARPARAWLAPCRAGCLRRLP